MKTPAYPDKEFEDLIKDEEPNLQSFVRLAYYDAVVGPKPPVRIQLEPEGIIRVLGLVERCLNAFEEAVKRSEVELGRDELFETATVGHSQEVERRKKKKKPRKRRFTRQDVLFPYTVFEKELEKRYPSLLLKDVARASFYWDVDPRYRWDQIPHDVFQEVLKFVLNHLERLGV